MERVGVLSRAVVHARAQGVGKECGIGTASAADVVEGGYADLVRLAALLLGSTTEAEDAVQDVYEALLRRPPAVRDADAVGAYVRRAVVNRCLTMHRRRRMRSVREAVSARREVQLVSRDHEDVLALRDSLAAALARLPRRQRAVVVLRYYSGLGDDDIGAALGMSPGAVRSNALRGMRTLRQVWDEQE